MRLVVEVGIRVRSLNAERSANRWDRASAVADERWTAKIEAREEMRKQGLTARPLMDMVRVEVFPWVLNRRYRQDIANCYPSVKACIDGFVDARMILDDDDTHLRAITFRPHQFGRDALVLVVTEVIP